MLFDRQSFVIPSIILAVTLILRADAAMAEPKPILTVIEYSGWGGIGHPFPTGLRFVAYDDGTVMVRAPSPEEFAHRFMAQRLKPADILALASETERKLKDVRVVDQGGLPTDLGWTIIQYWSSDTSKYSEMATYGMPCFARGIETEGLADEFTRPVTDPKFLEVCDALLGYPLPNAKEWHPSYLKVFLNAQAGRPDASTGWPKDWPRTWEESKDGKERMLCVPIANDPSDVTARMLSSDTNDWIAFRGTAVEGTKMEWWSITDWAVSMPGEISMEADGRRLELVPGPCNEIAVQ